MVTSQLVGTTAADAEGRFTLAALPKFKTLEITATHPNHTAQTIEAFVVPRGDERLDFHLRGSGVGRIEGTITDASTGLPIALARVGLPAAPMRTVSEGDGLFVLVNAPAGTYDLTVSHPAYFPATIAGVTVISGATSTASATLTPRPRTGGIYGVVRRAAGDLPVPGAVIAAASGLSTTADADGKFSLTGLPSGLESFTVSAPGFAPRVKTAVVDADVDAVTPTQRYVEFDLSATPLEASAAVPIEGGSLELPDGSVRIDFPPLALSGDARVTLERRAAPEVQAGETLGMDPALGIDGTVAALGEEFVLRIESATPGATAPFFAGPILVSGRYSAAVSAALGGREDVAFPIYHDADQGHWTVPQVVPHLHLVDTVNRLSVTGLSMLVTETGAPVTARLVSPEPVELAGFVGLPVIRQEREIVMALARKLAPLIGIDRVALVHGLVPDDLTFLGQQLDEAKRWDPNAQPLLVFHGWSPASAIWNVQPEPKAAILERYAQIMGDLARGTDGVYRPAYATYNTRLGLEVLGNLVATRVAQQEGNGALRGIPSDPMDPLTGPLFGSYEAFGFSMGGLIERAYQRQVNGTRQQIRSMVTMGTPHHGGLQQVRNTVTGALLAETGFLGPAALETLLALWSPGTADLLDYSDLACRFVGADFSGNPTLCRMNRDFLTAPSHRLSLIAGTDSISLTGLFDEFVGVLDEPRFREVVEKIREAIPDPQLLGPGLNAIGDLASVGFAATGCVQSDGVVCVWSAHARTGPRGGDSAVPALASVVAKEPSRRDFNHLEGGSATQSIADFADDDIVSILSDHFVGRLHAETHFVAPTEDELGEVRFQVDVEYNAQQGDITGLVAVVYGRYEVTPGQFAWKILAGADEDGEPSTGSDAFLDIEGENSVEIEEPELLEAENLELPSVDAMDPSTRIDRVQTVLVGIGPSHPTVPLEPDEDSFHLPSPPP